MLGVTEMSYFPIHYQLISTLVERWRPEIHTFHMTFRECTIILKDVSVLLSLKVHGDPITGCSTYRWVSLVEYLFGITPPPTTIKGGRLKMSWVDQYFFDVSMHVHSVQQMERYYLVMLTDLDQCGQLSWGSALLAHLYRELCLATNYDNKEISGHVFYCFVWQLYLQYFYSLPPYCVENTNIWRVVVPLIDFHIIEYHHVDRVMRQFGMVQHIPCPPRQLDNLHDLTLCEKDDIDWRVQHAVFVHKWERKLDHILDTKSLYYYTFK
uniref:Serine/threonine protein phosphatase 7 long form isogeny n=1 Tax=Cajanus cajan TaxID=3821 RepID=A0A151S6S1_CAJCA|nr:Serine/threonine protein phosphatase 7 long form isogeny [Cajanus cajan]